MRISVQVKNVARFLKEKSYQIELGYNNNNALELEFKITLEQMH